MAYRAVGLPERGTAAYNDAFPIPGLKHNRLAVTHRVTQVAVLGSTGSIGRSTLEVIAASAGRLRAVGLAAGSNTALLLEQAQRVRPRRIAVADVAAAQRQDWSALPAGVERGLGPEAVVQLAAEPEVDIVVSAIVGSAGLRSTWAALEAGKTVALANKETLVVGGPLITRLAPTKTPQSSRSTANTARFFRPCKPGGAKR